MNRPHSPCRQCLEKWGQEPSRSGDTSSELRAYDEHMETHGASREAQVEAYVRDSAAVLTDEDRAELDAIVT